MHSDRKVSLYQLNLLSWNRMLNKNRRALEMQVKCCMSNAVWLKSVFKGLAKTVVIYFETAGWVSKSEQETVRAWLLISAKGGLSLTVIWQLFIKKSINTQFCRASCEPVRSSFFARYKHTSINQIIFKIIFRCISRRSTTWLFSVAALL